jgi:hypothetical protein
MSYFDQVDRLVAGRVGRVVRLVGEDTRRDEGPAIERPERTLELTNEARCHLVPVGVALALHAYAEGHNSIHTQQGQGGRVVLLGQWQRPSSRGQLPDATLRAIQEPVPNEVVPRPMGLIVHPERTALGALGALGIADVERLDHPLDDLTRLGGTSQVAQGADDRPEEPEKPWTSSHHDDLGTSIAIGSLGPACRSRGD